MTQPFYGQPSVQREAASEKSPILQGSALAEAHGATFNWPPVVKQEPKEKGSSERQPFAFDLQQYNAKTYAWV